MSRATYLLQSEVALLGTWGRDVRRMFDAMPYLVGSCLTTKDHRDVDVRVMLDGDDYSTPFWLGVNLAVSLWGQKVTGLPIDFQVQQTAAANAEFDGRRHPIGMKPR